MQGPMQAALEKAKLSQTGASQFTALELAQCPAPAPEPATKRERKKTVSGAQHGQTGGQKEKFTAEFKRKAVALYQAMGDAPAAAKALNIPTGTLYTWIYRVEHGGKLHDSLGMEPWMGERYINPNPQKNPTGNHAVNWKDKLSAERTPLSLGVTNASIESGPTSEEVMTKIEADFKARAAAERTGQLWPNGGAIAGAMGGGISCAEKKDRGYVPEPAKQAEPHYAVENRLRAENEALRQIIRGFYALLHLN